MIFNDFGELQKSSHGQLPFSTTMHFQKEPLTVGQFSLGCREDTGTPSMEGDLAISTEDVDLLLKFILGK